MWRGSNSLASLGGTPTVQYPEGLVDSPAARWLASPQTNRRDVVKADEDSSAMTFGSFGRRHCHKGL